MVRTGPLTRASNRLQVLDVYDTIVKALRGVKANKGFQSPSSVGRYVARQPMRSSAVYQRHPIAFKCWTGVASFVLSVGFCYQRHPIAFKYWTPS